MSMQSETERIPDKDLHQGKHLVGPRTETREQAESTLTGSSGAKQPLMTSSTSYSSLSDKHPTTIMLPTDEKSSIDVVQRIFGQEYQRYLEECYTTTDASVYPGYIILPHGVITPGSVFGPTVCSNRPKTESVGTFNPHQQNSLFRWHKCKLFI